MDDGEVVHLFNVYCLKFDSITSYKLTFLFVTQYYSQLLTNYSFSCGSSIVLWSWSFG